MVEPTDRTSPPPIKESTPSLKRSDKTSSVALKVIDSLKQLSRSCVGMAISTASNAKDLMLTAGTLLDRFKSAKKTSPQEKSKSSPNPGILKRLLSQKPPEERRVNSPEIRERIGEHSPNFQESSSDEDV